MTQSFMAILAQTAWLYGHKHDRSHIEGKNKQQPHVNQQLIKTYKFSLLCKQTHQCMPASSAISVLIPRPLPHMHAWMESRAKWARLCWYMTYLTMIQLRTRRKIIGSVSVRRRNKAPQHREIKMITMAQTQTTQLDFLTTHSLENFFPRTWGGGWYDGLGACLAYRRAVEEVGRRMEAGRLLHLMRGRLIW